MAETVNISKIAEKLSDDIFPEFFWGKCAPTNENWPCKEPQKHKTKSKTHPSDVVFYYDEPYYQSRTYVNCDLKSYALGTITAQNIKKAIVSLAEQVECANQSQEFHRLFVHGVGEYDVCGLLFVYNHDGEYDKDFKPLLDEVNINKLSLPSGQKMFVLGPQDIEWLDNICIEIRQMRSKKRIPDQEHCSYFYPQLETKTNVQLGKARAATLEMLTSPLIVLRYTDYRNPEKHGCVVFYRGTGEESEEFLFIIDYLKHFQELRENNKVRIKMLNHVPDASAQFKKAVQVYIEGITEVPDGDENTLAGLVRDIEYSEINRTTSSFSTIPLGMDL
jgi:hypothetical protein